MKIKRTLLYLLGSIVVIVAMAYLLKSRGITPREIKIAICRFHLKTIFLASLPIIFIQIGLQISRLWAVLPSSRHRLPPLHEWPGVARAFSFGQAVNAFAPARMGDAVKLIVLQRENKDSVTLGTAAGALLSDKSIDVVSLILLSLLCFRSWGHRLKTLNAPHIGEWALEATIVVVIVVSLALYLFPKIRVKVRSIWQQIVQGLVPLRVPAQSLPALLFSMLGWCGELWAIRILAAAQGYPLNFNEVLWSMIILNIGVAVPIALANFGAFEAAMTLGLLQVGVPAPIGLAVATAHHALQIVCVFLWAGVLALIRAPNASLRAAVKKTAQSL